MKKTATVLIMVATLLFATNAMAQDEHKVQLYLSGGITLPSSPSFFSDYWNLGFNGGAGIGYIFSPIFSANAYFDFNSMSLDDDAFLSELGLQGFGISIDGGSVNILTVMANVKATLITKPNSVSPYLKLGVGLFSISATDVTVSYLGNSYTYSPEADEQDLGMMLGAGLQFPVSPTILIFVEGNWGIGFTEGDNTGYIPIKAGALILL